MSGNIILLGFQVLTISDNYVIIYIERDDDMNQEEMGKFIAKCRKDKNITQEKLSELLRVDRTTISKWERGISSPDISILKDLCKELDISILELFECNKNEITNNDKDELTIKAIKFYEKKMKNKTLKNMIILFLIIILSMTIFLLSNWYNKYDLIYITSKDDNIIVDGNIIYNKNKQILTIKNIGLIDNSIGTDKETNIMKMTIILVSENKELYKQTIDYEKSKYISYAFEDINIFYDSSKSEQKNKVVPNKTKVMIEALDEKGETKTYLIELFEKK